MNVKLTSKGKKKVDKLINNGCSVTYETIEQDIPLWVKDGFYENSFVNESMTKEIPVKLREYTDFINEALADYIGDWLSDEYGYCHDGFEIKVSEE